MTKNKFFYLILALFLAVGCEKTQNFALNILPKKDFVNAKMCDTFTVDVKTELYSHVNTAHKDYVFFGSYKDPIFGYTKASFVIQPIQLGYPKFNDSCTVDSVILYLAIDKQTPPYGTPYNSVPVYVYEVSDTLYQGQNYYSDQDPKEFTNFHLLGKDEFRLYQGGNDTMMEVHLSNELGQRFLDSVKYYFFTENDPFTNRFKGLYITPGPGYYDAAIYKIALHRKIEDINQLHISILNNLVIYYHPDSLPDTVMSFRLPVTSMFGAHFTLLQHDYTGTSVVDSTIDSVVYLQSGGTRIRIRFPYIHYLKNKVIYKAELVFKLAPVELTHETSYPPLDPIYLVAFDKRNPDFPIFITDFFDRDKGVYNGAPLIVDKYKLNVTRIIQGMIDAKDSAADTVQYTDYYLLDVNAAEHFGRSVLTTQKNSNPLKLVIFYSDY